MESKNLLDYNIDAVKSEAAKRAEGDVWEQIHKNTKTEKQVSSLLGFYFDEIQLKLKDVKRHLEDYVEQQDEAFKKLQLRAEAFNKSIEMDENFVR